MRRPKGNIDINFAVPAHKSVTFNYFSRYSSSLPSDPNRGMTVPPKPREPAFPLLSTTSLGQDGSGSSGDVPRHRRVSW